MCPAFEDELVGLDNLIAERVTQLFSPLALVSEARAKKDNERKKKKTCKKTEHNNKSSH